MHHDRGTAAPPSATPPSSSIQAGTPRKTTEQLILDELREIRRLLEDIEYHTRQL